MAQSTGLQELLKEIDGEEGTEDDVIVCSTVGGRTGRREGTGAGHLLGAVEEVVLVGRMGVEEEEVEGGGRRRRKKERKGSWIWCMWRREGGWSLTD